MANIECEIRSFISERKYQELVEWFQKESKFLGRDEQVTYYFTGDADLRIQQNSKFSKIWLKKGKIHNEHREEIEIKFAREDFDKLEKLFLVLGYEIEVKWFRQRHSFEWNDIDVCLDYTRGYGYIIELEKICRENEKEKVLEYLKSKLVELGIPLTPREEFDKKYSDYKENWRGLI